MIAVAIIRDSQRGVYKFQYNGKVYWRLGNNVENAKCILQRELKTRPGEIQVLDGGKRQ